MSKVKEFTGCFVPALCCTKCDWFSQPIHRAMIPRVVCPKCGEAVELMVGRYLIKETKKLFSKETEYIGFKRKQKRG